MYIIMVTGSHYNNKNNNNWDILVIWYDTLSDLIGYYPSGSSYSQIRKYQLKRLKEKGRRCQNRFLFTIRFHLLKVFCTSIIVLCFIFACKNRVCRLRPYGKIFKSIFLKIVLFVFALCLTPQLYYQKHNKIKLCL